MLYLVFYTEKARQDLHKLDRFIAQRILKKVKFFSEQTNPLDFAEPLKDFSLGHYRFRLGDYRVIFDVDKKGLIHLLMILRIRHRKDIYHLE